MAQDYPITTAIRFLRAKKIDFTPFQYDYEEKGGTAQTARVLNVDEHCVIKTLILETEDAAPFVMLQHGDREVSLKELARILGKKKAEPCEAAKAAKFTGYLFGGTSPFGTKRAMPVLAEAGIFSLDSIYINGGKRGFIVKIAPSDLRKAFDIIEVNVAIEK